MLRKTYLLLLILILIPGISHAEIKTYTHTVKQSFVGSQSPDYARVAAIAKAKREVLEKSGTYLESLTVVKNYVVEKDEILALSAGILKAEIVSQKNFATEETFGIIIVAKVDVDTSIMEKRIEKMLQDRELLEVNQESQQRIQELLAINEKLEEQNRKFSASVSKEQQEKIQKQFQDVGKGFKAVELLEKAKTMFKSGKFYDPKQALEYLNKSIDLDPENAMAYSLRAFAYLQLNKSKLALKDCNQAIRLSPDSAKVYAGRGFVYKKIGQNRSAIEDLSEALRLKPNYAKAYAIRGGIYLRLRKHNLGCEDVRKACELNFCYGLKHAQKKGYCR